MPSADYYCVYDTCMAGNRSPSGSVPSGGSGQYRSPDLVDTEKSVTVSRQSYIILFIKEKIKVRYG